MKTIIGILMLLPLLTCAQIKKKDPIIFEKLLHYSGAPVLTNAEFRGVLGRRVTFKTEEGKLVGFDVTDLHRLALERLKIDTGSAISEQEFIDEKKKAALAATLSRGRARSREDYLFYANRRAKIEAEKKAAAEALEKKHKEKIDGDERRVRELEATASIEKSRNDRNNRR